MIPKTSRELQSVGVNGTVPIFAILLIQDVKKVIDTIFIQDPIIALML